jgi:hypothetical protein
MAVFVTTPGGAFIVNVLFPLVEGPGCPYPFYKDIFYYKSLSYY